MGDIPTITTHKKSRKRKQVPEYNGNDPSPSPPPPPTRFSSYRGKSTSSAYDDTSSDGFIDDGLAVPESDDILTSPKKKVKTDGAFGITPAIDKMGRMDVHSGAEDYDDAFFDNSFDGVDIDAFMDVDDEDIKPQVNGHAKKVPTDPKMDFSLKVMNGMPKKKELSSDNPSWLSVYDSLSVTDEKDDTLGPLNASTVSTDKSNNISVLEADGSLRFFWLDYLEHEGKLYFIGKLQDKATNAWVSCCVTVENLQRNLYVLPREKRMEDDEEGGSYETDEVPGMKDVYNDFDQVRKKAGIKSWRGKFVKRNYAFGEADVPKEASWLKVVYGFNGTCFELSFLINSMLMRGYEQNLNYPIISLVRISRVFSGQVPARSSYWCSSAKLWDRVGFKSKTHKSTIKAYVLLIQL